MNTYDLSTINTRRIQQGKRPLTREQAAQIARGTPQHADFDLATFLVTWTVINSMNAAVIPETPIADASTSCNPSPSLSIDTTPVDTSGGGFDGGWI